MSDKYSYYDILKTYDQSYPLSKTRINAEMAAQMKSDYNQLIAINGENLKANLDSVDNFLNAINDPKLAKYVPNFLKNKDKSDFERVALLKRFILLKMIVQKIENEINGEFPNENFKLNFSKNLTFSSGTSFDIVFDEKVFDGTMKKEQFLNVDVGNVFKYPAAETYFLIKDKINNAIFKYKTKEKFGAVSNKDLTKDNDSAAAAIDEMREKATYLISEYLKTFIEMHYGSQFSTTEHIAKLTAGDIVNDIIENQRLSGKEVTLSDVLGPFFDKELIEKAAATKVEDFLETFSEDEIVSSRAARLEFLAENESEAQNVNYRDMSRTLLKTYTNYRLAKESGMFDQNVDIKKLSEEKIREICVNYGNTFMGAHNLKNIAFTFEHNGVMGEYTDSKNINQIKINVDTNKIESIPELYMTLSHELTHAADSATNKINGKFNADFGGLLNDISEDISEAKGDAEGYAIVKKLQSYCYLLNPNERNARLNELSGLMYVKNINNMRDENGRYVNKSDAMESSIRTSVNGYIAYQRRVQKAAKEVQAYLSSLVVPASVSVSAKKLIDERISYLNGLIENKELNILDTSVEQESIEEAKMLYADDYEFSNSTDAKTSKNAAKKEAERKVVEDKKKKEERSIEQELGM